MSLTSHRSECGSGKARLADWRPLVQSRLACVAGGKQPAARARRRVAGWSMAGHILPAQAVGGDFYELLPLADGRLGILIGDVAGKGNAANVWMAAVRSHLRAAIAADAAPAAVLARANAVVLQQMPRGVFVTCFYAVIDPATGIMTVANAGHVLPFLRTLRGAQAVEATGLPLGLLADATYDEAQVQIGKGDTLVFYSDGITEARNASRDLFGFSRLQAVVAGLPRALAPAAVGEMVLGVAARFTGGEQEDDIALLVLHREMAGA